MSYIYDLPYAGFIYYPVIFTTIFEFYAYNPTLNGTVMIASYPVFRCRVLVYVINEFLY